MVKEERIRAITKLYYSNPKVQEALLKFSKDREVVPRYFEGFGKRPDSLQYNSDIMGLVNKGATSFHASEELWEDVLAINSDMTQAEFNLLRKSWDLLIDIDSSFLDCSKIATDLIIKALEHFGIKNYGIKFSGSKGFHIIVAGKAFPEEYNGMKMSEMFPEWPRAISEYLMYYIRRDYNIEVGKILSNTDIVARTGNKEKEENIICKKCGRKALRGVVANLHCPICGFQINRRDAKTSKRKLKCINARCAGILESGDEKDYWYCEYCKQDEESKANLNSEKNPEYFEKLRGENAEAIAKLDLILVAPRHLFRMPYSLHEKTSLASVVLKKEEIKDFEPKDADPLKIKIRDYLPENEKDEAKKLLSAALEWKKGREQQEEEQVKKKYFSETNFEVGNIDEKDFPKPIKKLLNGIGDGKKRGLFILLTFLKSINYSPEKINQLVREWNKKNEQPLKEGYLKSQIEWHLRQKKKILPPNYDNPSFYKDLGLLDEKPNVKNPLVDAIRKARRKHIS
ncbi:MAG: hypothetical protein AABW80_01370 [Nanoarchaeota archaeon]